MDCILQAPPSVEFSRQEYWSALPFLSPGDLVNPEVKPGSPSLQADSLPSEPPGKKKERKKKKGRKEGGRERRKKSNYNLWKEPCAWVCECSVLWNSDPRGCSLPGSSVPGIFQARILEWVAISSLGNPPNPGMDQTHVVCISYIGRQILYHWAPATCRWTKSGFQTKYQSLQRKAWTALFLGMQYLSACGRIIVGFQDRHTLTAGNSLSPLNVSSSSCCM